MKTTKKLDLKVLCAYRPEEITLFINDGTVEAWFTEAADELAGGDKGAIAKTLKHNISSKITNTKKGMNAGVYNPHAMDQLKVADLLKEYCNTILNMAEKAKPQAQYTIEDIEAITDYALAQKVYDSICSVKRDAKVWSDTKPQEYEDACKRFEAASKKRKDLLASKPVVTDEQLAAIKGLKITKTNLDKLLAILGK